MSYAPQPPPSHYGPPGAPRQPLWRGPLLFGVIGALALAVAAAVLVVSSATGEEEPAVLAARPSDTTEPEPEPKTGEIETSSAEEESEEPTGSGGAYTAVDDLCAVMEPIVADYMTIDESQTKVTEIGDAVTCRMGGEMTRDFDRPSVSVTQDVDETKPDGGVEQYGYGVAVRSNCDIEEDVLPDFMVSAYYQGSADSGCTILGHTFALDAADGNMFINVNFHYGSEAGAIGGEEQVAIDLVEAVVAAS